MNKKEGAGEEAERGGDSLYMIALRTAMEQRGLSLDGAYEEFKAYIEGSRKYDKDVPKQLAELEKAVERLRAERP